MAKTSKARKKLMPASAIATYEVSSAKRLQYENLMWQVPALSLSAQAVLISVTLNSDNSPSSRLITSMLSALVGFISIQLLQKHRYHEVLESKQLEEIEKQYKITNIHGPVTERAKSLNHMQDRIESLSGFKIWRFALLVFALTGIVTTIFSIDAAINASV